VTKSEKNNLNLFSEFTPATKAEWEKIMLDTIGPGEDLSKLNWNLRGLQPIPPLFTKEDIDYSNTTPVVHTASWGLCEHIAYKKLPEVIVSVKEAAQEGTGCCLISNKAHFKSETEIKKLKDSAKKSGVELIFESSEVTLIDDFKKPAEVKTGLPWCVNGSNFYDEEVSIPHQLAVSLSIASEYLITSGQKSANSILFRVKTGSLYFPEIAKLRALRILWYNLVDSLQIHEVAHARILSEVEPSETTESPYNNLLISVTKAMAAILGGTDLLLIHPFGKEASHSEHITRNIHHILREEAYFGKVADAAAGSYYIETLTDQIAAEAWKRFGEIEKNGGFLKSLKNGIIPEDLS